MQTITPSYRRRMQGYGKNAATSAERGARPYGCHSGKGLDLGCQRVDLAQERIHIDGGQVFGEFGADRALHEVIEHIHYRRIAARVLDFISVSSVLQRAGRCRFELIQVDNHFRRLSIFSCRFEKASANCRPALRLPPVSGHLSFGTFCFVYGKRACAGIVNNVGCMTKRGRLLSTNRRMTRTTAIPDRISISIRRL